MPDLLVNLLKLTSLDPVISHMREEGVILRRALPHEMTTIRDFVIKNFSSSWADEISVGFANKPVSIYLALREGRLIGFGAYECAHRGFFGPTGVSDNEQGRGIGKAILLACLWGLKELGYAYGIIGGVGPVEFYQRAVGATLIPDSTPGVYANPIKRPVDSD